MKQAICVHQRNSLRTTRYSLKKRGEKQLNQRFKPGRNYSRSKWGFTADFNVCLRRQMLAMRFTWPFCPNINITFSKLALESGVSVLICQGTRSFMITSLYLHHRHILSEAQHDYVNIISVNSAHIFRNRVLKITKEASGKY